MGCINVQLKTIKSIIPYSRVSSKPVNQHMKPWWHTSISSWVTRCNRTGCFTMFKCYFQAVCLLFHIHYSERVIVQLTRTKLEGNQASWSPTAPHHQSCSWTSRTWITSPALKASSCSSIVTWSHRASACTACPDCMYWRKREIKGQTW